MTYPLSSDVVAGQPTAAEHYNNLRADALRLGQAAGDSKNLAELFARFEQNLTITILGTDRVRVPGSTGIPVTLVVDGYFILRSTVNVDLPSGGKPSGSADMWYLFAVRTSGSDTFTLEVNTSAVESSGRRLIGSFYWNGSAIEAPSIRTSLADSLDLLINHNPFTGCQGRLSFTYPVPTFGDASGSTIYLLPYKGNQISFFTPGWGWKSYPIPATYPPALNFTDLNTSKCYDVFAYWDGATVQLTSLAWTNLLSRATPLTYQDGLYTLSSDPTLLYLGTFLPNSSSVVNDLPAERGLWNFFNRAAKHLIVTVADVTWTYNNATWRSPDGTDRLLKVVTGLAEDCSLFNLDVTARGESSLYGLVGIGLDSNSVNSADIMTHNGGAVVHVPVRASLRSILAPGAHSIYWLEATEGSGNVTFYGEAFPDQSQSGLTGQVMG